MDDEKKERLMELVKKKDVIESEIKECGEILAANKNVGMHEPLVDEQDFPRSDIDVVQVRYARNMINRMQTYLKELMIQIENGLAEAHADSRKSYLPNQMANMEIDSSPSNSTASPSNQALAAFLVVTYVNPNSPAELCGLQKDDQILLFGSVNADNFRELKQISDLVTHQCNQKIALTIKRGDRTLSVQLIPKQWQGRGLLGCNIITISMAMET